MEIRRDEPLGAEKGLGTRTKVLVAGSLIAALLTVGAGAGYAVGQTGSMMGNGSGASSMTGGGMGSMMGGNGMETMMGDGRMGSMMDGGMMGDGQMQMMGTFDEDKPFDLQFIDQMIMHHSGALMSSEMMIADSDRPELRQLAENIEESQSEQIEQMKAMRERWYPDAERTFGMMDPTRMDEMMGEEQMDGMMGGSMRDMMGGDATDEMFLRMMIPHHQMAVEMSEKAIDGAAEHPELEELAQTIKEEQSAEIEQMRGYLEDIEQTTAQ